MRKFFVKVAASSVHYEETRSNCSLNTNSVDIADDIADAVDSAQRDLKRKLKLGSDDEEEQAKHIPRFGSWLAD